MSSFGSGFDRKAPKSGDELSVRPLNDQEYTATSQQ